MLRQWLIRVTAIVCLVFAGLGILGHQFDFLSPQPRPVQAAEAGRARVDHRQKSTTRILGQQAAGSGVILARRGQTYTILTCEHVVSIEPQAQVQVLTFDGRVHRGKWVTPTRFAGLDLAIVTFRSARRYPIATPIPAQTLELNIPIYVAGFPNYQMQSDRWQDTRSLGVQPYQLLSGEVALILPKPLEQGYQLGLSAEVESGMSGGPVWDDHNQLVGIIGRRPGGLGGAEAYQFADGSQPSAEFLAELESLSWAIPIDRINPDLAPD